MSRDAYESFREGLARLVAAFERDVGGDKRTKMSEPDLRIQFLDPLFIALGWDVGNRALTAFHGREVVVEPPHRMQGHNRRPDYLFRVSGIDKFVCEAKRPGEDLPRHHFQVQNYIFNLKLWVGVLSDFEHFQVFLVGSQPNKMRAFPPLEGWNLHYTQYESSAQKLWDVFARDSVVAGSLEQLAQAASKVYRPGKQGWLIKPERAARIDDKFLQFLEDQRARLAKSLHRRNRELDGLALTEATQKIINRLLFQRICEDRDIDVGRTLAATIDEWEARGRIKGQLWRAIVANFLHISKVFNGGLFGKPGDEPHFVDDLDIPEDWLAGFLDELAGDDSTYLLSVIPVEILGSVYERFLGSVVSKNGEVERKPEVRKSNGVYYTPKAIVDEIVERTVGASVAGKSPRQLRTFRIVDPACGSGSFLLASFERLCRHHVSWLLSHPAEQKPSLCYISPVGDLRLTTGYKRTLLINSIFGVDLDSQAVEVTQMSLYLKVLEDETTESLTADHRLFPKETYLPSLENNIKVGDSLIELGKLLDLDDQATVKAQRTAFDWQSEFPAAFKSGGFDVVVGNPPYFSIEKTWGQGDLRLDYLKSAYGHVYQDRSDILFYFLARAADISKGTSCFIVSRAFLEAHKAQKLRGWLSSNAPPSLIIDFGNRYVFDGVGITTAIIKFGAKGTNGDVVVYRAKRKDPDERPVLAQLGDVETFDRIVVPRKEFGTAPWLFGTDNEKPLIAKIDKGRVPIGSILPIGQGMQTGLNDVFGGHPPSVVRDWELSDEAWYIRARNSDIRRWLINDSQEVLLFPNAFSKLSDVPKEMRNYLQRHRALLQKRAAFKRGDCEWWQYTWPLHSDRYDGPRILCPYLATENHFALDEDRRYLGLTDTTVIFPGRTREDFRYFLALLNSKVLTWRFRFIGKLKSGGIREYFHNSVAKLPVHRIDWDSPRERGLHKSLVGLATRLITLKADNPGGLTASMKGVIVTAERKIDESVCDLYGLSPADYEQISRDLLGSDDPAEIEESEV